MRANIFFTIAWRNLWRHRGKSLVIGVILCFGAILMTVGNGMISGMEQGLSENIVNLFTGDIVVISDQQVKNNVLFDATSYKPLKVIQNYASVQKVLAQEAVIDKFLPATAGMVFVFNSGSEMGQVILLGVDIENYRKMFPDSFMITGGRMLQPGERGVLISEEAQQQIFKGMNFWVLPGQAKLDQSKLPEVAVQYINNLEIRNDLVFMGASTSNSTMDVRVPVTGIMKYKALNKVWGSYCIVDIESFREANNYVTGADSKVRISEEQKKFIESKDLDQMFSSEGMFENVKKDGSYSIEDIQKATRKETKAYTGSSSSYNLAFVKLKKNISQKQALESLNQAFQKNNLPVRAIGWRDAVGAIGSMAMMIKSALNLFIMFIFFVAIIVIMNTLSMAALERVPEFGMMRAIGAQKSFLRKMFVYETGILTFFFGGLGIIGGVIIIYLLKMMGVTTSNEVLQLVYGGDMLNPLWTIADFILGLVELGIVSLLAVLYPLRLVGKIVPMDAITRE